MATVTRDKDQTVITLSGAVLFGFGRAALLPVARERLDQVAEALRAQGEDTMFLIEGAHRFGGFG